jgi:hypothetical protein
MGPVVVQLFVIESYRVEVAVAAPVHGPPVMRSFPGRPTLA